MASVSFSGMQCGGGELRIVGAVLEMAGLETYRRTERIINVLFSFDFPFQPVACVDMDGRFCGIDFHFASACLIVYPSCRTGIVSGVVQCPGMVVTVYYM